jgi:conjugative transfer signal peptidase TraF
MKECIGRASRLIGRCAITILLALVCVCLAGLRINGSHSFPVGLYWATAKRPEKGDLVFVDPPALPIFELALNRGYLDAGYSPAGSCALIKRLVGVAGDRVTINDKGVEVDGVRLSNSKPRDRDGDGRPLQPYSLTDYILGSDEILLMSDQSAASFDARYFGPLSVTQIRSVIMPLITWK